MNRPLNHKPIFSRFPEDLTSCNAANHCTAISFSLKIEDEESGTMKVIISLLYEKNAERPKPGSLKVTFEPELDEEALESVKESMNAFYEMTLCEAITQAFL